MLEHKNLLIEPTAIDSFKHFIDKVTTVAKRVI